MNFYSSNEFLEVLGDTYFPDHDHNIEYVRAGDLAFRLLVVDDKKVISKSTFMDYHSPIVSSDITQCTRSVGYIENVTLGKVSRDDWLAVPREGITPAPYIDWRCFSSLGDYREFITSKQKRLVGEYARRRRRLIEELGEISFSMHDEGDDVVPLAREWKTRQLTRTGATNFFVNELNSKFLLALLERNLLACSTLRAQGRLLAVWIGFIHDKKWSGWIFTHDPDEALRKYSLGHQLLHSMVESSHAAGHLEFDFSIGGEEYKWAYATHARLLGRVGRPRLLTTLGKDTRRKLRRATMKSPSLDHLLTGIKRFGR